MMNLNQTNLINKDKQELLYIAKQELQEYKEARQYNQVSSNIPRIKNLEALEKRLAYFSLCDSEVSATRNEIKSLLNEDVYKKPNLSKAINPFSSYEEYLNARLRSR